MFYRSILAFERCFPLGRWRVIRFIGLRFPVEFLVQPPTFRRLPLQFPFFTVGSSLVFPFVPRFAALVLAMLSFFFLATSAIMIISVVGGLVRLSSSGLGLIYGFVNSLLPYKE